MPKPKVEPTTADTTDEDITLASLVHWFGAVGVQGEHGWQWVTDGRRDPYNQRIKEVWLVQVTWQGKSWVWAHRTEKAARKCAGELKGLDVKNVRVWRGRIDWEAA